jgi:hypothetical protein
MLVFIVTFRSRNFCQNWRRLSALCERTVRSICNQTSPEFRVVLVCHEPPEMNFRHPALEIISRPDLPIPKNIDEGRRDKWLKVRLGLISQRGHAPVHVMVTDADDCVSNRLAAHVAAHPESPGWYFDSGYVHDENSRSVFLHRRRFDLICGSSAIVRSETADLPIDLERPEDGYPILFAGHTGIHTHMHAMGRPLSRLPFTGTIYVRGTGENINAFTLSEWHSKKVMLRKLFWTRPLTAGLRQEYGLYALPVNQP